VPKATKIRAKAKDGVIDFRMLMRHDMESGFRKDENTGDIIPAWFIKKFSIQINSKKVLLGYIGPTVSKNPYIRCMFKGKAGDEIRVEWSDSKGETRVDKDIVKG
jgi:sulfur-oxidizing protein SoxZ